MVKSSETVPRQRSLTSSFANVLRLIAVEPPQQKFFAVSLPSADATDAFQTPRRRDANPPLLGTNQRYPVEAPSVSSASGATRCLSQSGAGRASVSTKTSTSAS